MFDKTRSRFVGPVSVPACLACFCVVAVVLAPASAMADDQPADGVDPQNVTRSQHEVETMPPAQPPAVRETSPAFTSPFGLIVGRAVSVQVNVDASGRNIVGDAANEPSISIDPRNANRMIIGWRQFDSISSSFREAGYAYSEDNGRTWRFPGVLENNYFRSDPVVMFDPNGLCLYYSLTLQGNRYSCQSFITTDNGRTWTGPISAYGGDKAWTAFDLTNGIGRGNFYAAWDDAGCCGDNWFTRSIDGGRTYMSPIPIPGKPMWGTACVAPDGALYIAGQDGRNSTRFRVTRSSNAQNKQLTPTFEHNTLVSLNGTNDSFVGDGPNPGGLQGQIWIAADYSEGPRKGWLYMCGAVNPPGNDPIDIHFCRSTDRGVTWSTPVRINDDVGTNAYQWFATMSVAPNGRIDVIWNDTRNTGVDNRSEVYYSFSLDGGDTWSVNERLSPVFDSYLGWPQQNKLGDYYHMISDNVGASLAYAATFNGEQDVYYMRIGEYDCNGNGVPDPQDLLLGTSTDLNHNEIPDECDGLGDMNCDDQVDFGDINAFVLALGGEQGYQQQYPKCRWLRADVNGDNKVDFGDINGFVQLLTGL